MKTPIVILSALCLLRLTCSQCIYNLTHCSCMQGVNTGKCLRDSGGGMCTVDSCAPGGLVCDCAGADLCEVFLCTAMMATDGNPNSAFSLGDSVPCSPGSSYCLSGSVALDTSPSVPSPSQGLVSSATASQSSVPSISSSHSSTPSSSFSTSPLASISISSSPSTSPSTSPSISSEVPPSLSSTPSSSSSSSISSSPSPSYSSSPSSSITPSASMSPSITSSVSSSPSSSTSPSSSPSPSISASISVSNTPSESPSVTPSLSPSSSATLTPSPTTSPSTSNSPSSSSSPSGSPSVSSSMTSTPSESPSSSATPSTSPTPSNSPYLTHRMVQFGDDSVLDHTFNMSQFVDNGNRLRNAAGINGQWGDGFTARRMITFRIYNNVPNSGQSTDRMICAIYNPNLGTFDDASDPFRIQVDVKVTGFSGQTLSWIFCDEQSECQGTQGNVLYGSHDCSSNVSDGFCVGDFEENGNIIAFEFSNVFGIKGFSFEDPTGIIRQYYYKDMGLAQAGGLVGAWVDLSDRVHFGISPVIKFNWQGFEVPL